MTRTSAIDNVRGTFSATLNIDRGGHPSDIRVQVLRDLTIAKDTMANTWLVMVRKPEDRGDDNAEPGTLDVVDPAVNAFLDQLALLLANPDAFVPAHQVGTREPIAIVKPEAA